MDKEDGYPQGHSKVGDDNMEMRKEREMTRYVKADSKKVLDAIKRSNKKYSKAMKALSK